MENDNLRRCIETLRLSLDFLQGSQPETTQYEVYRNAVIKGFELILEMTANLLRKALKAYGGNPKSVDELSFKDVFRHAGKRGLMSVEAIERWFVYRANRNIVAHDYGQKFAEQTLVLLPQFVTDAAEVANSLHDVVSDGAHD